MLPDPLNALWVALKARGIDMSEDALTDIVHSAGVRVSETDEKNAAKAHEIRIREAAG